MGGGVGLLDYDNDGWLDVFFTNGATLTIRCPPATTRTNRIRGSGIACIATTGRYVHRRDREGRADGMPHDRYGMGVAVGDYDNDGFDGSLRHQYGGNTLYHNNGDGTFTDVTTRAGVGGGRMELQRGVLRLRQRRQARSLRLPIRRWTFQTQRLLRREAAGLSRVLPSRATFRRVTNILYHNNGDGTFTDVSTKAGIAARQGKSAGRGIRGLRWRRLARTSTSPTTRSVFPVPQQSRRHVLRGRAARRGRGQRGRQAVRRHGRGFRRLRQRRPARHLRHDAVERDATRSIGTNGNGTFTYATRPASAGSDGAYSGWGTRFVDYDNDGWKDLFVAQGHVLDTIELTSRSPDSTGSRRCCSAMSPAVLPRVSRRRVACRPGPAAAPRSATWTTTATSTSSLGTCGQGGACSETTAAIAIIGSRCGRRHAVESRWPRRLVRAASDGAACRSSSR